MKNFNSGWYVVYTRSRYEKKICNQLTERGIEYFFPVNKILKVWSDRKKYMDAPLFPSYVFIYLKDIESMYKVLEIDGVVSYIRSGKEIVRVTEKVIDDLKLIFKNDKEISVSERYFESGQKVVIHHGPLTGLDCEIVECYGEHKILVRVSFLKRSIILSLLPEQLTPENRNAVPARTHLHQNAVCINF
ncbi:transcription termination/antitermination protein NusG [Pedobacter sp. WC2423]|uniref:transcription termination/antitermination protein NusG n=1 Tax=Pedobacter sp. WC2423 TaxID=3234142 RepID=UPI003466EBB7